MKGFGALQSRPQRTYDSDFESIENPRYAQPHDDEEVKTAPRQSVEPKRNIGVNDAGRLLHSSASMCRRLRCLPQCRRIQPRNNAAGVNRFRRQGDGGLYGSDVALGTRYLIKGACRGRRAAKGLDFGLEPPPQWLNLETLTSGRRGPMVALSSLYFSWESALEPRAPAEIYGNDARIRR